MRRTYKPGDMVFIDDQAGYSWSNKVGIYIGPAVTDGGMVSIIWKQYHLVMISGRSVILGEWYFKEPRT